MKIRRFLVVISIITLPVIIVPVLYFISMQFAAILSNVLNVETEILLNLSNLSDHVSVYLSVTSIIISILLVYYIQKISSDQSSLEMLNYSNIVYSQTCSSLRYAIENNVTKISITEKSIDESFKLLGKMSEDEIEYLIELWNILLNLKRNPDSSDLHQKILKDHVFVSFYSLVEHMDVQGFYSLFSKRCCYVLNKLNPNKDKNFNFGKSFSKNGALIFESYVKDNEDFFKVYERELIYDCSFCKDQIRNGYAVKHKNPFKYVGFFKEGAMNGEGKLFYCYEKKEDLLRDGKWTDDKFTSGTVHFMKLEKVSEDLISCHYLNRKPIEEDVRRSVKVFSAQVADGVIVNKFDVQLCYEEDGIKLIRKTFENLGKGIAKLKL